MRPGRLLRVSPGCLLDRPPGARRPPNVVDLRAGNDLVLEEYLDGVEFDVDLVLEDGECVFSSVSQNWPTAEPSFQETGLHCPPDHGARAVRRLVRLSVRDSARRSASHAACSTSRAKCTPEGPRIVEVNARMGGGRIHQIVEAVWGVDLIEAHVRAALGLAQQLAPSRKPRCAVVDQLVYAPATGRLASAPTRGAGGGGRPRALRRRLGPGRAGGGRARPDLLDGARRRDVGAKNLKRARALAAEVLRDPPVVIT